jgi:GNAT superfamily N-acetyltransferase
MLAGVADPMVDSAPERRGAGEPTPARAGRDELWSAAAANFADWHRASLGAIGLEPRAGARWWTCALPAPTIYHSAISLVRARPGDSTRVRGMLADLRAHLDDPGGRSASVCDTFAELPLHRLGLRLRNETTWCARPPASLPPQRPPAGLRITVVSTRHDLMAFERTITAGFGAPAADPPLSVVGAATLDEPDLFLLMGRDGSDQPVGVAMVHLAAGVAGIYGVTTLAPFRSRGYATALTRATLAIAPDRPAVLQPTPAAAEIYRRFGFTAIGRARHWG